MMESFKQDIEKNEVVIAVIPNKEYKEYLNRILLTLTEIFNKICYISLNKPYNSLIKTFEQNKIDSTKFIFIDCVTASVEKPIEKEDVIYVSSPKALTELSIAINKTFDKNIDVILFDSISTLLVYENVLSVIKFVHSLISMLRTKGFKGIFTCLKEDIKEDLIKDLNMFADKIIDFAEPPYTIK